ncbi:hypothetical protein QEH59_17865 [Coraliomargarita sp. SDUM461004]|uniref:SAM-dependent methyltransferase n=1 Tax=Thalassobacterium sedimentorum TaxID=3041258 RepID=A0ABU1AND2_9BACT|nr:hypothetical protein [Coraliomargarita sp. SDUM461004]MDQ8196307.1 hypothetical protein [Coraliomargarita sp. SDUM461004]
MSFQLNRIVPWGRTFDEYVAMFELSAHDLGQRILGCGDGPASFNAELTAQGGEVISIDPLYLFETEAIQDRVKVTYPQVLQQVALNESQYVWTQVGSIQNLGQIRMNAMNAFLADYPQGCADGRYIAEALPSLSFPEQSFDLALCSHFLFLYDEQLDLDFHLSSIKELCRVAKEVRMFPLLNLAGETSQHLDPVLGYFMSRNYDVEVKQVAYEFQKGGNQMLCISA